MASPAFSEIDYQDFDDFCDLDDLSEEDAAAVIAALFEDQATISTQAGSSRSSVQEQKSIAQPSESAKESRVLHVDINIHATVDIPFDLLKTDIDLQASIEASIEAPNVQKATEESHGDTHELSPAAEEATTCGICTNRKPLAEFFDTKFCSHLYCNECVGSYVTYKVLDGIGWINCPEPGCEAGILNPDTCHPMLPQNVIDLWGNLICEATIRVRFYCPHKDCSALLMDDDDKESGGREIITQSECPHCYRMFCAQCRSLWHEGMKCEDVQELGEGDREREDLMLKDVAGSSHWQRCPECKFFVERNEGCNHITCRSGLLLSLRNKFFLGYSIVCAISHSIIPVLLVSVNLLCKLSSSR